MPPSDLLQGNNQGSLECDSEPSIANCAPNWQMSSRARFSNKRNEHPNTRVQKGEVHGAPKYISVWETLPSRNRISSATQQ